MYKMNGIIRSSLKLTSGSNFMNIFRQTIKPENAKQRLYSTFWNASLKPVENNLPKTAALWNQRNCLVNQYSTRSDSELVEFLEQEINAEQQLQKSKTIPSKIDDFEVRLDGSEVTLTKTLPNETIKISFNINHSIQTPEDDEMTENISADEDYTPQFKSKPTFDVDIKRGDVTLGFTCSFVSDEIPTSDDEMGGDIFAIQDITLFKGEHSDKNYSVSGEILDGCLYDLLMNFLDEKGISNEFVNKMSELSTVYEHSSYISLLRDLKQFASS